MSNSIRFQITPKIVDEDNNELDLSNYIINTNYTKSTEYTALLPNADKYVSLPVLDDMLTVEFISDQEVYLSIWSGASMLVEIANTSNMILKSTTPYTFKVRNLSNSNANVIWRVYS